MNDISRHIASNIYSHCALTIASNRFIIKAQVKKTHRNHNPKGANHYDNQNLLK